jgi:hypothetical protein
MSHLAALILAAGSPGGLEGLWHAGACVGSGFSELYALLPGGRFVWAENSMDGMARLRERRGTWTASEHALTLSVESTLVIQGGVITPVTAGSTATDSEITGGDWVWLEFSPPETLEVSLDSFRLDRMDDNWDLPADLWGIDLDGVRHWRISTGTAAEMREYIGR